MALKQGDYEKIRSELEECKKPLFFFHDDPDGVASFLLLYRYCREGAGVVVNGSPKIDRRFLNKVEEYNPDKIFILDIALVDQEFFDNVKQPVIWIDHHEPSEQEGMKYFNPRVEKREDNIPVSYLCYKVVKQDLWIAMIGAVGDWYFPDYAQEFMKEYPDLLDKDEKNADDALFKSRLGELIMMISFVLKGRTSDIMTHVKVLTRIKDPYEIIYQKTPAGAFIYKRYAKIKEHYEELMKKAVKKAGRSKFLIFKYPSSEYSLTKELANTLLYNYKDKVIVIGREKDDEIKFSIRSHSKVLPPIIEKALQGVDGYGGGHEYAVGVCIKKQDYNLFIKNLKREFKS